MQLIELLNKVHYAGKILYNNVNMDKRVVIRKKDNQDQTGDRKENLLLRKQ